MGGMKVGFAVCGSFCTFKAILPVYEEFINAGHEIIPIFSEIAYNTDTRFFKAREFVKKAEDISGNKSIHTIAEAEPIGPRKLFDILIAAPCTGNTLAKLACGITDSCVTMACKAHLRNLRPLVLGVSTNDGLSTAMKNIGELSVRKNIYFVPYRQDDPNTKPNSLVFEPSLVLKTAEAAIKGYQLQPVIL